MTEAAELIAALRAATMGFDWSDLPDDAAIPAIPLLRRAADHIETLEASVATLSAALEKIAKPIEQFPSPIWTKIGLIKIIESFQRAAREASR
jgi:hypothetical protein